MSTSQTPYPATNVESTAPHRLANALFFALLALFVVGTLLLPVFPSGDGPVHIYLAQILGILAHGRGGLYAQVYAIRHLVQPYSLHYFWLIGFRHWLPAAMAEKLFVVAILLVNALGFRRLACMLGPGGPSVALMILPLLPGWALGSGFLNFCFAIGAMFFAYAEYLALREGATAKRWLAYILLLALLVLAHPVPLMVLILLLGGECVLLWLGRSSTHQRTALLCLALACLAFAGPMLIADKSSVAGSLASDLRPHLQQLQAMVLGYRLSMFAGLTAVGTLLTLLLLLALPASAASTLRRGWFARLRQGEATTGERLCLVALAFLLATIIFPESMNGSALFADRMLPIAWPLVLACAAAGATSLRAQRAWLALGCTGAALSLLGCALYLLPVAQAQAALDHAPLPDHARGLFVTHPVTMRPFQSHLRSELMVWGGARVFVAHGDVLLNTPWMQLTIVPVGERGKAGLLRDALPGEVSEDPSALYNLLRAGGPRAQRALATADFLLFSSGPVSRPALTQEVQSLLAAGQKDWRCVYENSYAVCQHERQ